MGNRGAFTWLVIPASILSIAAMVRIYRNRKKKLKKNCGYERKRAAPTVGLGSSGDDLHMSFAKTAQEFETLLRTSHSKNIGAEEKLMLYALYKQATVGNNDETKAPPSRISVVKHAKFEAWNQLRGMPREIAMIGYVEGVNHILKDQQNQSTMSREERNAIENADIIYSDDDESEEIDDDGEDVQTDKKKNDLDHKSLDFFSTTATRTSTLQATDEQEDAESSIAFPFHRAASEGNVQHMKDLFSDEKLKEAIHQTDDSGQTPLHLAADRGHLACVQFLVEQGADVNARDGDGMNILLVSVMGGSENCAEVIKYLLEQGANANETDNDGISALSWVREEDIEELRGFFQTD